MFGSQVHKFSPPITDPELHPPKPEAAPAQVGKATYYEWESLNQGGMDTRRYDPCHAGWLRIRAGRTLVRVAACAHNATYNLIRRQEGPCEVDGKRRSDGSHCDDYA